MTAISQSYIPHQVLSELWKMIYKVTVQAHNQWSFRLLGFGPESRSKSSRTRRDIDVTRPRLWKI